MGCGYSKLTPEGEPPLPVQSVGRNLRRRIGDIRKVRDTGKIKDGGNETLSKKQLLKDGGDEEDDDVLPRLSDINESERLSNFSREDNIPAPEPVMMEEKNKVCWNPPLESAEKRVSPVSVLTAPPSPAAPAPALAPAEEDEGECEDDEEDLGRRIRKVDDEHPSSPSFRVYYIESMANKTDDDSKDDDPSQISQCEIHSGNDEKSASKMKKKGRGGNRFRKVMSKGQKAGGVKNLFHCPFHNGSVAKKPV